MKTIPLRERFATGLRAMGYEEAPATTHYRVFKKDGEPTFYLGRSGALRYSRTHRVTDTVVADPWVRERILGQDAVPTHEHYGKLYRNGVPELPG